MSTANMFTVGLIREVLDEVKRERIKQIEQGWTLVHDDEHKDGEIALAAACYALESANQCPLGIFKQIWPWDNEFWKPRARRRNLIRATALLVAEIERLDRVARADRAEDLTDERWVP